MSGLLLSLHLLVGRLPGYNDHPVVVRSLRRSPGRSAEQLLRQEEVEESLLANAAADGGATTARADWSKMAMVYLGQDRLYTFNQWSGDYSVWQYGALIPPPTARRLAVRPIEKKPHPPADAARRTPPPPAQSGRA